MCFLVSGFDEMKFKGIVSDSRNYKFACSLHPSRSGTLSLRSPLLLLGRLLLPARSGGGLF
jgi:hypothetical protein